MKKIGGNIFSKVKIFEEIAEITSFRKISSSFFQYSERTIASRQPNDTCKERSDTQLLGAGKFKGMALSGGLRTYFLQKIIEQKVNLMEQSQD